MIGFRGVSLVEGAIPPAYRHSRVQFGRYGRKLAGEPHRESLQIVSLATVSAYRSFRLRKTTDRSCLWKAKLSGSRRCDAHEQEVAYRSLGTSKAQTEILISFSIYPCYPTSILKLVYALHAISGTPYHASGFPSEPMTSPASPRSSNSAPQTHLCAPTARRLCNFALISPLRLV